MGAIEREIMAWCRCDEEWMAPLYTGVGAGLFFFCCAYFGG